MKISAIQPNYYNKIAFKNNTTKPEGSSVENAESEGMSKNTKIAIGVSSAVALAALAYAGYRGHLGAKIQKFLGGAEDAASTVKPKGQSDVNPKPNTDLPDGKNGPEIKTDADAEIPKGNKDPEIKTDSGSEIIIDKGAEKEKIITQDDDIVDAEIIEDVQKFLTVDEFKTLPLEEKAQRFGSDVQKIVDESADFGAFEVNINKYAEELEIDLEKLPEGEEAVLCDAMYKPVYAKFAGALEEADEANLFRLHYADVKMQLNKYDEAENLVMDVINSNKRNTERRLAFEQLKAINELQGKPEQTLEVFAKSVDKDVAKLDELHNNIIRMTEENVDAIRNNTLTPEQMETYRKFSEDSMDSKQYFANMHRNLSGVFGEDNATIVRIKSVLDEKIPEFFNKLEGIVGGTAQ